MAERENRHRLHEHVGRALLDSVGLRDVNREALDEHVRQEAARLHEELRRIGERGRGHPRPEKSALAALRVRNEALDLLRELQLPGAVVVLFDALLGSVARQAREAAADAEAEDAWIAAMVDYEARAHNAGRVLRNSDLVDVVKPLQQQLDGRDYLLRKIGEVRGEKWYRSLVDRRRVWLRDNE